MDILVVEGIKPCILSFLSLRVHISPIKTFLGPPSVHDASTVGLCKRHKGPQMTLSQTKEARGPLSLSSGPKLAKLNS